MEYNNPLPINTEKDLQYYEDYLKENFNKENLTENIVEINNNKAMIPKTNFSTLQILTTPVFSNGYLRKNKRRL